MAEKRSAQRVETDRPVQISGGNRTVKGRLVELSLKGALVESPLQAKIGTRLKLRFDIPAGDHFADLNLYGTVKRAAIHQDYYLLGIEFEPLSDQAQRDIQAFIDFKQRLKEMSLRPGSGYGAE